MAQNFEMQILRKNVLPAVEQRVPGALYLIRSEVGDLQLVTTDIAGGADIYKTLTKADVEALIAASSAAGAAKWNQPLTFVFGDQEVDDDTGFDAGSITFDGSEGTLVISDLKLRTVIEPGQAGIVSYDKFGRVIGGRAITSEDLPDELSTDKLEQSGQDVNWNAATATKLKTGAKINGKMFDGSTNIILTAADVRAAPLVDGLIPNEYISNSIDSVVEVNDFDQLPGRPNANPDLGPPSKSKLYVVVTDPDVDPDRTSKVYRWSGSVYIQILDGVSLADQAMSLYESRKISIGGAGSDGTWEVLFKGNADVIAPFTLNATGVTAGDYGFYQVDAKGRLTFARALTAADIPTLDHTKVISAASIVVNDPAW